ncbi:MAG: DUF11 domain-containing protein [Gallionella sp.]
MLRTSRAQQKAFARIAFALLLNLIYAVAWSATPPGTPISNTATASYTIGASNFTGNGAVTVNTAACIAVGVKIELLQYNAAGSSVAVQPGAYSTSGLPTGPFNALANPTLLGSATPTALPATLPLSPLGAGSAYSPTEPIFVRVTSYDANINPAVADTVLVTLTTSNGDSELVQLTETGPSTGVFVGAVPSSASGAAVTPDDGIIAVSPYETITAVYNHTNCSGTMIANTSSAMMDPYGMALSIQKTSDLPTAGIGDFVPYTLSITNKTATPFATAQIADYLPSGFHYQKGSARQNGVAIPDPVISADARTMTFSVYLGPSATATATATVRYVVEVTPAAQTGTADNTAAATGGLTSNTAHASIVVTQDLYSDKAFLIGRVIDGSCDDKVDNDAKGLANARIVLEDGSYILTDQDGRWHIDNLRPGTHVVQLDLDSLPKDYEVVACEKNDRFAGRSYSQFVNLRGGTLWRADFHVQRKAPEKVRITQTLSAQPANDATIVSLALVSSAEVTSYSATVMLPESARYVPGSAKLNGAPIADPDSVERALIFRSHAHPAPWQDQYSFAVEAVAPDAALDSMVRFTPPDRAAQNLPVAHIALINHAPASAATSAEVTAEAADIIPAKTPKEDDPTQMMEVLPYDAAWLASAKPGNEWLHPQESFHPNLPVMSVAVKHDPANRLELIVNGKPVNPLRFDGQKLNADRSVALSTWRGVEIDPGDNKVELVISDTDGKVVSHTVRNIHFSTRPDHVEFVPQQSRLIADGKTRPIIAVRLLDKDGVPIRRGITGEFTLNDPYRSSDRSEGIDREPLTGRIGGKARFVVKSDGLAMIELEPTTQTGEAILNFQFIDTPAQEVRAWLEPGQRDWILVGFGQGTVGQKTLSGNMQSLQDADADKQLFDQNGLALYAKGSIRGDYLLTLAYDTTKQTGDQVLKQGVDPTQYYTLYADATQAKFDAASSSRLYVKLERKQFYAMFGDYDTGLTVTELSRYSRTLNGVKSEYKGDKAGYNAFATVTSQAYIRDQIPGNGTSGVYKLTRGNLMVNSEKISIVTFDRFQSQNVISTQIMAQYLDYDIDYVNGTLTFHEPINARDSNFNPTSIVAEYESNDSTDQRATLGGRGSYKPAQGVEVGATLIHDGTVGASGNLQGVDTTIQLPGNNKLRAEAAATTGNNEGVSSSGEAWLTELSHHDNLWDGKAYMSEQSDGFGLGQQAASESGTRKFGLDGSYKLSDTSKFQCQAYQQESPDTGVTTSLVEGRIDNRITDALSAYYGASSARSQDPTNGNSVTNQLEAGTSYTMLDKRLSLHAATQINGADTAGTGAMPNTLTFGSDYKLTEQSKLFAEQEFARGDNLSTNTTRVGIRTQPWMGNEMSASVGGDMNNDAERIYANMGMVQSWQINKHWQTKFSIDRTQTLNNTAVPLNPSTPLPSGPIPASSSNPLATLPAASSDYLATSVSAAYHDTVWSGNGRIEIRNANLDNEKNLDMGAQRKLDQGRSIAASYSFREADSQASGVENNSINKDLRLSYADRPNDSRWVWLDRADYITQYSQTTGSSLNGSKVVNNLNANYLPNRRTQIALQYGAKYVLDTIDGTDYKGYTDLTSAEIRHDVSENWDIGMFGSMMRSVNAGVTTFGFGVSFGRKVVDNMWVTAGYNVLGMNDRDFSDASYRAKGPFITLRMKVDQDTFGLNKGSEITRPMTTE